METWAAQVGSRAAGPARLGLWAGVPEEPRCAPEALHALSTVADRLQRDGDRRAAFPDIYAIITRRVVETVALEGRGAFLEPRWIDRLAGRFCSRYLATLRWSLDGDAQDTAAWSAAYASCADPGALPLQRVLLGLSAHINYDLAVGIAATMTEMGAARDPARQARMHHDHDAVNCLLRASIPEAFDHLVVRHACPASRAIFAHSYGLAEWLIMEMLTTWRARVWEDALELVRARTPAERDRVLRRLSRRSRWYARVLATPAHCPSLVAADGGFHRLAGPLASQLGL
jgi:hypothetical protein